MEDNFDSLLDFGDSTGTSTTNGTAAHDPNDPFSSPTKPVSGGALLDFSFDPFAQDVNGTSKSHDQNTNPFGDDPFGLNSAPNSNFEDGGFQSGDLLGGSLEAEFAASISTIKTAETTEVEFAQEENNHGEEIPESNDLLAQQTNNVQELESPVTPGTEEPSDGFSEEAGDYRDEQYEDLRNDYKEEQFEEYRTEPQETNEEELPEDYRQEELSPVPQQEYQEPEQHYQEPEPEYREPEPEPEQEYREPEQQYHEPEHEYQEPEPEYREEQQSPVDYREEQEAQQQQDYLEEHQVEHVDYQEDAHQEYVEESRDQFEQQEDYKPQDIEQEPYSPVRDEDNFLGQIEEIERMATQASTPESPMSPENEVTTPSSEGEVVTEQVATRVTEDGDTRTTVTETVKEVHEGGKTIIQTEVVTETHTENTIIENDEQQETEEEPQKMEPEENDIGYEDEECRSSKSLIRAFEMEKQDYQPPKRVTKTETEKDSKSAIFIANSQEGSDQNTCAVCAKRVYEMEKLIANHAVYHKMCFKCTQCKRTLGVGNFSVNEGKLYCKPHFMQLFKLKGNYDEGFGRAQHKIQTWNSNAGNGTVSIDEGGDGPAPEVVRPSEDNREEEIQSLPSLRNIKSRFENRDEAPQKEVKQPGKIKVEWGASDMRQKEVSPSPPRDPEIFREQKVQTQEEVLVSYGGLTSIKSRYLESTSPVAAAQGPPPPKVIPRSEEPVQKAPSVSPPREAGVIRSDEPKDETEELPPQNITKGLLARFRDMESQSGNQPIKTTPAPRTDLIEADLLRPEQPAEAGEFENQPQFRDDVIREDDDNETEHLPASGNLKSRLAVFKQMEATTGVQSSSPPSFGNQYSSRQSPSRVNGNPGNSYTGEVLREGEANPEEELPQVGAAKSMREKFQSMQQTDDAPANSGDRKATAKSKQLLNSTVQPKGHRFTPPRGSPEKQLPEVTSPAPPHLDNVIRSDEPLQEEPLPTQEILHTCLNRFRQMEEEAKVEKSREYSPGHRKRSVENSFVTEFHVGQTSAPPKPPRTVATSGVDHTVYNPAAPEGGEFENQPIVRDDVIRESDNFEVQELPQEGQARKLREQYLAKVH